jgi:hypothetical protein
MSVGYMMIALCGVMVEINPWINARFLSENNSITDMAESVF